MIPKQRDQLLNITMSGLFEHIEMFDESDKVATRQAVAVANKRFNDTFAGFLRQASTKKEFESRLALISTDIDNMVADVANEYGGDAEKIASAIKNAASMTHTATCDCDGQCEGECSCGGCDSCKCASKSKTAADDRPEHLKAQDEIQEADEHSEVPPWLKKQNDDEDQEDGGNRKSHNHLAISNPVDSFQNMQDANQMGVDVGPGSTGQNLAEAVGDVGSAVGDLATLHPIQAVGDLASGVGNVVESVPVVGDIAHSIFGSTHESFLGLDDGDIQDAVGTALDASVPGAKTLDALGLPKPSEMLGVAQDADQSAANTIKSANPLNKMQEMAAGTGAGISAVPEINEGSPEAPNSQSPASSLNLGIDSESAGSSSGNLFENPANPLRGSSNLTPAMAKALQLKEAAKPETGDKTEKRESLPTGNEDAHDGPSPKIDKKKWKPNATNPDGNLKPIDTEGENSPHPTRQMDIKQKPDYEQDTLENLKKYDNNVWEREQLPSADDNAGFEGTRNIDQPTKAAETFPNKGQVDPVTREALSSMDKAASFRTFLDDIGVGRDNFETLEDDQKSRLWDLYNNYDMPKYMEEEGLADTEEDIFDDEAPTVEEITEEPVTEEVIEESPEEVEEIIEREDEGNDRVKVVHDHDKDDDVDLLDEDVDLNDEDLDEIDPFEFVDSPDEDELKDLIRDIEGNPDDWQ